MQTSPLPAAEWCNVSLCMLAPRRSDMQRAVDYVGCQPTRIEPGSGDTLELTWTVEGPSPVNAGRVANDLVLELLAGTQPHGPKPSWPTAVEFEFGFGELYNFSYEFAPEVVRALARLGAGITFYHADPYDGDPSIPFGADPPEDANFQSWLRISGKDLNPDEVTRDLGVQPHQVGRRGESYRGETLSSSFWVYDDRQICPIEQCEEQAVSVLDAIPTESEAWLRLSRDHQAFLHFCFTVDRLAGALSIRSTTMRRFAKCGVGLHLAYFDFV